jgi:hypothetical protein
LGIAFALFTTMSLLGLFPALKASKVDPVVIREIKMEKSIFKTVRFK